MLCDNDLDATTIMESSVKRKRGLPSHEKGILGDAIKKYLGNSTDERKRNRKLLAMKLLHPDKNLACRNLASYSMAILKDVWKQWEMEKNTPKKKKAISF